MCSPVVTAGIGVGSYAYDAVGKMGDTAREAGYAAAVAGSAGLNWTEAMKAAAQEGALEARTRQVEWGRARTAAEIAAGAGVAQGAGLAAKQRAAGGGGLSIGEGTPARIAEHMFDSGAMGGDMAARKKMREAAYRDMVGVVQGASRAGSRYRQVRGAGEDAQSSLWRSLEAGRAAQNARDPVRLALGAARAGLELA